MNLPPFNGKCGEIKRFWGHDLIGTGKDPIGTRRAFKLRGFGQIGACRPETAHLPRF